MSVNVEVLAKLARIALEDSDHEKIKRKVDQVLESFNQLNRVNTEGVEPFFHASSEMELREDTPEIPLSVEELLKNAPDSSGLIVVRHTLSATLTTLALLITNA